MEFLRVVLQTEKIRVQGLYCTLKHALSSSAPIDEDDALRLDHPHLPNTLPTRNLTHRSQDQYDYDNDGKNESYPVVLTLRHQGANRVLVKYMQDSPASPYSRETLFLRKGRNVEITIKDYMS